MSESAKDPVFKWTPARKAAAFALADGKTQAQAAEEAGIDDRTIRRWLQEPIFSEEVDNLTLAIGLATRAERLRIVKRAVAQRLKDDGSVETKADVLDWLKFAQSETTGAVNDFVDAVAGAIRTNGAAKG
jgi:transposase-like protein